jgi:hypothetical protein
MPTPFWRSLCADYLVDRVRLAGCIVSVVEQTPQGTE